MKLTKQQGKVLNFLKSFHQKNGYSPTRAEISSHFGWSGSNAATSHLVPLEKKGAIRTASNVARGIVILK